MGVVEQIGSMSLGCFCGSIALFLGLVIGAIGSLVVSTAAWNKKLGTHIAFRDDEGAFRFIEKPVGVIPGFSDGSYPYVAALMGGVVLHAPEEE